jgi:pimeloyl-ACP methyl ester carboxylesterase
VTLTRARPGRWALARRLCVIAAIVARALVRLAFGWATRCLGARVTGRPAPRDPGQPIRRFAEVSFPNILRWSEFDRGGHFAAMEQPDLFVGDLRAFARALPR